MLIDVESRMSTYFNRTNNTISPIRSLIAEANTTDHVINPLSGPLSKWYEGMYTSIDLIMAHDTPHTCTSTDVEGSIDTDDHTLAR